MLGRVKFRFVRNPGSRGEEGFTVIEMMAASAVILLVMSALAAVATSALTGVAFAKQRQTANELLGRTMEQVRALPFQTVANGLSTSDATVSSDANITVSGSTWTYSGTNETIPHGNLSGTQAPFLPHQTTTTLNATTYTVTAYPTNYTSAAGAYRVTAIISWTRSLRGGVASQVSGQTIVFSPSSGCVTPSNHPFAAPCQPFFHATTTSDKPAITITAGNGYSGSPITGINFSQAQVTGVKVETSMPVEQTSSVLGAVNTTGATLGSTSSGTVAAASSADNDPATAANPTNTGSVTQTASAITSSGGGNSVSLTPSTTDTGSTTATVSASNSPACNDLGGTALLSSLPCGAGTATQSGTTLSATASLKSSGTALGVANLASIASQPVATPTEVFAARLTSPTNGYCTLTSNDGCVHAAAQRSFGTIALAGLPANVSGPTGWGGSSCNNTNALVSLAGYSDQVVSESGVSPAAPTASQGGGTLYYWNGTGCSTKSVNWAGSPPAITIPTVTVNSGLGGGTTITISGTVTLGTTATTSNSPNGCVSVCTASATVNSPVVASISYVVKDSGANTIANMAVSVTLGNIAATSSYQAAV